VLKYGKIVLSLGVLLAFSQNTYAEQSNSFAVVKKVSVMGVKLCGDIIETGEYLERQGYKGSASAAKSLGIISHAMKIDGPKRSLFKINNYNYKRNKAVNYISFHGTFTKDQNLFEIEKSKFERETGIKLSCKKNPNSQGAIIRCEYPASELLNYNDPGFRYAIGREENIQSFFIDAAAWGYEGC